MLQRRENLEDLEARLRALRDEKGRATKVAEVAKAAAAASDSDETMAAAQGAVDTVRSIEAKIEQAQSEQVAALRQIGDAEAGLSGFSSPGLDGWHEASRKLSLSEGALRVDVGAQSLLQPSIAPSLPRSPTSSTVPAAPSRRWLYPGLEAKPFSGDLSATDYTVTWDLTELTALTGVEIEPATDTEKASISPTIGLATVAASTFAVVLDSVPSQLFDNQDSLRQFLSIEMGRRISDAVDEHVVNAIETAAPPNGSTGSTLVKQVRNAIAAMRNLGGEPTLIALTPSAAATLDLSEDTAGHQIFRVDLEGSGSPVWSLQVRESPSVAAPLLVDPRRLGVVYLGDGTVLVDPFGPNLRVNQVAIRAEVTGRAHVRNAQQGAYVIDA